MKKTYHIGELSVQKRAGVEEIARRVTGILRTGLPEIAADFLPRQRFIIASSIDWSGRPWPSFIHGHEGFIHILDDRSLFLDSLPPRHDPFFGNQMDIGLLAIEFATRRRMKIKGQATIQSNGIHIDIERVYALCPKYIHQRDVLPHSQETLNTRFITSQNLTPEQQTWISNADTFFLATHHPETGGDASHRGGDSGFVKVLNESQLEFSDYAGNNMFNSLGNIHENGRAGMLFIDFIGGHTLQITGRAEILWDSIRSETQRAVRIQIEDIIETRNAFPFKFLL